MKKVRVIDWAGIEIVVLMLELESGKAFISYFVDGNEVTEWSLWSEEVQEAMTEAADTLCAVNNLIKWSY